MPLALEISPETERRTEVEEILEISDRYRARGHKLLEKGRNHRARKQFRFAQDGYALAESISHKYSLKDLERYASQEQESIRQTANEHQLHLKLF